MQPAFAAEELEREKKVILEEIKMVEDTPDDLVHELFTQHFWEGHPLGRPILGIEGNGRIVHAARSLREYFRGAYVAPNMIVSAAGNLEHARVRELVGAGRSASCRPSARPAPTADAARRAAGHRAVEGARTEPRLSRAPTATRRTTTIATSATS